MSKTLQKKDGHTTNRHGNDNFRMPLTDIHNIKERFQSAGADARKAICEILELDINGQFKSAHIRKRSMYDALKDGETVADFVRRTYPGGKGPPKYRGKVLDGECNDFIETTYYAHGYLDQLYFNRAVLRQLDEKLEARLKSWMVGGTLPDDMAIPNKRGQAAELMSGLSELELKAARSLANSLS